MRKAPSGTYVSAFSRPPFIFGCAGAEALPGPVLVTLMSDLEGTPAAAKALLHRMLTYEQLTLERHGRVGVYRMAGLLLAQYRSIRDGSTLHRDIEWDGRFHTLVYDIPESKRAVRDHFRAMAFRHGYRPLRPGILLSAVDASSDFLPEFQENDVVSGWLEVTTKDAVRLVRSCWDLDGLHTEYGSLIRDLDRLVSASEQIQDGPSALRLLHQATNRLTDLRLRDAVLPRELLPADWPAAAAGEAIDVVAHRYFPLVQQHVEAVIAESGHAHLVVREPGNRLEAFTQ